MSRDILFAVLYLHLYLTCSTKSPRRHHAVVALLLLGVLRYIEVFAMEWTIEMARDPGGTHITGKASCVYQTLLTQGLSLNLSFYGYCFT